MPQTVKQAIWDLGLRRKRYPALEKDLAVDALVVGAGITGLSTATLLARAGLSVAVVEANRVASGTSGGTSAHLTEVPDLAYPKLLSRLGEEKACTFAAAYHAGLAWVEEQARGGIDCDLETVPAFRYSEQEADRGALEEEAEAARTLNVAAEWATELPLPFATAGAVRFPGQARFHPIRYLDGLARAFVKAGGLLFENSRVTDWEEKDGKVTAEAGSAKVHAASLVLATHTPPNFSLLQTELIPRRSYLLALRLRDAPPEGLFWDSEVPYHYFRALPDPEADGNGQLLLVGGEDHTTGHDQDTAERYRRLEGWAGKRFAIESVVARWSAQLYEPADGLPYIGRSPFAEQVLVATGFSGVGLSAGTMAGLLLSDLVQGQSNPWAEIFAATRVRPLAAAPGFVRENAASAAAFISDRLKPSEAESLDEVPRGEGRLLRLGGERLAVYRDLQGRLSARSPVCTHLGCLVRWNTAEATWDCPCHGGRFKPDGTVLEGPPTSPLEPRELPAASRT